ncbi:MAG: citrate (Si)-synthase, partial [Methylotenera sp.]|nr:citrate (Si)-synthase [Methylotenera sp.]
MIKKPTKATLTFDNGAPPIELPMLSGTLGNDVIDIRSLGKHGIFTYDPGFMSTAACNSNITFIDGEEGLLYYRGYPIEQLAEHCNFMEVSYLLLHGELPNVEQTKQFTDTITENTMLHDQLTNVFR